MARVHFSLASLFEMTLAFAAYMAGMTQLFVASPEQPYYEGDVAVLVSWLVLCWLYLRRRCGGAWLLLFGASGVAGLAAIAALRGPTAIPSVKLAVAVPPALLVGVFLSFPAFVAHWLSAPDTREANALPATTETASSAASKGSRFPVFGVLEVVITVLAFLCTVVVTNVYSPRFSDDFVLRFQMPCWTILGVVYARRRWRVISALHGPVALISVLTATGPFRPSLFGYAADPTRWAIGTLSGLAAFGTVLSFSTVLATQLVMGFRKVREPGDDSEVMPLERP